MSSSDELKKKLQKIGKVFDIDQVLNLKTDKEYIQTYYKANKLAYSLFHTFTDRMYMGVTRGEKYSNDDLLEAARFVEKYIKKLRGTNVLELATGRGATSSYLAERHPKLNFFGIDISQGQLDFAYKKAQLFKNYHPTKGDYHNLSAYSDKQFDIVFEIEAVCYSLEKNIVLKEVYRVLKPGGVFILFDGYLKKKRTNLTKDELLSVKLTEKGMAVTEFENYNDFIKKAKQAKFNIDFEEDVSYLILPTLHKFERLANKFFSVPFLSKQSTKILSKEFLYNAIAGYLMPNMVEDNVGCYYITILKK